MISDPAILDDGEEVLKLAEQRGDDYALAKNHARACDVTIAIEMLRAAVDDEFTKGGITFRGPVVTAFVETLLQRGGDADVRGQRQ